MPLKTSAKLFSAVFHFQKRIRKIRRIRSDSVGHPTFGKTEGKEKSHFLQRISLEHCGFTLMTVLSDGTYSFELVDIPAFLNEQKQFVQAALLNVVERLGKDEMTHRSTYKDKKLQDIFQHIGYDIS